MASSRKSSLTDRVAARLAPLLPPHSHILIGLSGGMDSVVLLHLLHNLAPRFAWRLSALHVHHGISPNADAWADFCIQLCAQSTIPLHIERVTIAPLRAEHGIEAAARKLRHAAFAGQDCDYVALAHHADDQAETLLLQLLRGAGIKGVAAMPVLSHVEGPVLITSDLPAHPQGVGRGCNADKSATTTHCGLSRMAITNDLAVVFGQPSQMASSFTSSSISRVEGPLVKPATVRPLLDIPRDILLEYAHRHALQWVEDESNADDSYPRNFLRHRLLPLLEQKFPAYRGTLTRSAQHFAEAGGLLDELAQLDAQGSDLGVALDASHLRIPAHARAKNLLRFFLHVRGAPMPQSAQLDEMLHQLLAAREDAAVCVDFGHWQVRRYRDKVYAFPALPVPDKELIVPWSDEVELPWPALGRNILFSRASGSGINYAKLQRAPVTLRLRSGGESLRPHPGAATRSLKNLLQEHHVPPWQRERLPLLYCGDELVSVVGVAVSAEYQACKNEEGVMVSCE